jgi:molecular chaperone DnaK (HSP70)
MIAIDFGTTNSSAALFTEGDVEPRMKKLSYGDADSVDPNVIPSAVSTCRTHECAHKSVTVGHEAFRHYFNTDHDIDFLQEMELHFDRSTKEAPTLVTAGEVTTLREEGGFLSLHRRTLTQAVYEGDVPLLPADFVPGTAKLISRLIELADAANHRSDVVLGVPASFREAGKKRLREAACRSPSRGPYFGVVSITCLG